MSDAESQRFYRKAVLRHGATPRGVGWASRTTQYRRFEVMDRMFDLRGARVLDVGCGAGALYGFLAGRDRGVDYVGIDPVPEMVEQARGEHPGGVFLETSLETASHNRRFAPHSFDYVFASGIFSRRAECDVGFVAHVAGLMFGLSRQAVLFNSLSASVDWTATRGWSLDPAEAVAPLLAISPHLSMVHMPELGDVAFVLRHGEPPVAAQQESLGAD